MLKIKFAKKFEFFLSKNNTKIFLKKSEYAAGHFG